jgi:hypothetical protein
VRQLLLLTRYNGKVKYHFKWTVITENSVRISTSILEAVPNGKKETENMDANSSDRGQDLEVVFDRRCSRRHSGR